MNRRDGSNLLPADHNAGVVGAAAATAVTAAGIIDPAHLAILEVDDELVLVEAFSQLRGGADIEQAPLMGQQRHRQCPGRIPAAGMEGAGNGNRANLRQATTAVLEDVAAAVREKQAEGDRAADVVDGGSEGFIHQGNSW